MKKVLSRILALAIGLAAALFAAEHGVRVVRPFAAERTGYEVQLFQGDQKKIESLYQLDEELGYRPIPDTFLFDEHGFRRNELGYDIADRKGRERVLFSGDSVTFRQKIIDALREVYGVEEYEYWNGGVTAYNTTQEVAYFERFTRVAEPDHVVLTFHLNDFIRTPISFKDESGRMQVITPGLRFGEVNPWLLQHSHLYRHLMGMLQTPANEAESERAIRAGLERFVELSEELGFRFTVVVFPIMLLPEEWNEIWQYRYEWISRTLAELGIRHFFLEDALRRALADGVECEQFPGDVEHCSVEVSTYFAEDLKEAGLLDPPGAGGADAPPVSR